jgi:hypothetical protein
MKAIKDWGCFHPPQMAALTADDVDIGPERVE